MSGTPPVAVFLREPWLSALRKRAADLRMGEGETATRIVEAALEPFIGDEGTARQARAERELVELAEQIAREEVGKGWNERLTLAVFERIARDHRALYDLAAARGAAHGLNRRLGRRISEAAGAEVKLSPDRKPVLAKVPAGSQALVRRYTLLVPRGSQKR